MKNTIEIPEELFEELLSLIYAVTIDRANDQSDAYESHRTEAMAKILLTTEHADKVRETIKDALKEAASHCGEKYEDFEPVSSFLSKEELG